MNKRIVFLIFLIILIVVAITVFFVTKNTKVNNTAQNSSNINKEGKTNTNQTTNNIDSNIERKDNMVLYIKVNNKILTVTLENNSSVYELLKKLEEQDITIDMEDYANFEKVGSLGFSLARNDQQITTKAGDIILYQGNQFVIYYDTNSWNFTKLGHIENITQDELKKILGVGDVIITLSLND